MNEQNALIQKRILSPGEQYIPLTNGTRVKFHFQTRKANDGTIVDDSRKIGQVMQLVLGKKFKLEVWEVIVQKMALNEVAKFTVDKTLVTQYPFVSKTLRDMDKPKKNSHHCCGLSLQTEGLGYKDLDELLSNPCDLEFIIELVSVELPEDYQKETWQLTDNEKLNTVTKLKEQGNQLYKSGDYEKAEECYRQAVSIIEQLMLK